MRFSHSSLFTKLSVLGYILTTLSTIQLQVTAAPIRLSNSLSHFPYPVTGPKPYSRHRAGQVLDTCIKQKSYAISFDDGPGQLTEELLDFLDEQNIKVTFFMNGDNWNCIYSPESRRLLKRAFNSQHQIAAHPWSHRDFELLSDDEIRQEMQLIENAFRSILGVVPRYMRPPYGEHSKRVRKIMEEMGYVMILWDVDQIEAEVIDAIFSSEDSAHDCQTSVVDDDDEHHRDTQLIELEIEESQQVTFRSHRHKSSTVFSSKWAEAVRGVPSSVLDRDAMVLGGIYQEATSIWAVEYVQSQGLDIMPVGACLGDVDPRLWYKEITEPTDETLLPRSCHA